MKATTPAMKLMSKNHIIIILLSYKLKLLCFYLVYTHCTNSLFCLSSLSLMFRIIGTSLSYKVTSKYQFIIRASPSCCTSTASEYFFLNFVRVLSKRLQNVSIS